MFQRAIVRPPGANFVEGHTSAALGTPSYARAVKQHDAYCAALERCGLILTRLEPDERYPDSTFVEDTAVLIDQRVEDSWKQTELGEGLASTHRAIITRPGAISRREEVTAVKDALGRFYSEFHSISDPGTVDGGDVCQAGNRFFIGISERTNEDGAQQLAQLLRLFDYASSFIDIREQRTGEGSALFASPDILHLKSGLSYLGDNRMVVIDSLAHHEALREYELIPVDDGEEYAANCLRIGDFVLIAAGYRELENRLRGLGYKTLSLDMTEFRKMDGGLSCLSLRF